VKVQEAARMDSVKRVQATERKRRLLECSRTTARQRQHRLKRGSARNATRKTMRRFGCGRHSQRGLPTFTADSWCPREDSSNK
jgi:hypothetical protein